MNKRVLLFIVLFLNASLVFGQDLKGVKVLINPGHGGHDPANDRHIVETDFWESEGNLSKGLYLREILLKLGATVYMSRTANEDADDLPLSDIVAMANQNNVEYMHSIHSNAAGGNYTLILYQGNDNAPTYPEAKAMSQYIGNEIFSAHRTTDLRLRGDFDFYGTGKPYLGVFRGLNMPGSLSEGSFHDYIPESWRLKNQAYLKHEAWAIAKAFLAYWRKPAFTTGIVAGIVRDPEQTSGYTVINPQDSYKPVNNIQITIKPLDASNTMAPRVCKGDSYNNGFFMFDELTPGSYKVYYEAAGYFKDSSTVTVQASKNTFADKNLVSTGLPEVVSVTSATGDSLYPGKQNIVIEFTRSMNMPSVEAAITTNPSAPLTFSWSGDKKVTVSTAGLPFNMNMTLTVAATAVESSHGLQLDGNRDGVAGDGYTYSFRTMIQDVISPVVTEVYPFDKQENVELIPYINVTFSEPLNTNTMSGKVKLLKTSTKTEVRTTQRYYKLDSGKAIIGIYPSAALQQNETYSVVVVAGLEDQFFNKVPSDIAYNFKTGNKPFSITPIDNFETGVTNWASPTANSSIGFVSSGTAVDANTYYRLIGSNRSMQISYSWDIDAA
ncbi:MAG: hypothetical protein HF311_17040, partial [Ignavibacteria bacterium]|nr:hypothetical protein [Ignavibacteria bacterium]